MNERIQELYREAEKSVAFLSNSKESKQLIIREKFAELIVRECIDQVEVFNARMDAGPRHIVEAIKQHFGVKVEENDDG